MKAQHKVTAASFTFYPKQENRLAFARLRVALDQYTGHRDDPNTVKTTSFVTVLADGQLAERMNEELRKGSFIEIFGEWQTRHSVYQGEPREEKLIKLSDFRILSHSKAVRAEMEAAAAAAAPATESKPA